jgi:ubiquinol-cytochrome c reductase subunit 6
MENLPENTKSMVQRGQDPKEMLMEACKPECKHWFDKLSRCESALKNMKNADPEMSCMYPLRDWVTCLEGCVTSIFLFFYL